MSACSEPKAVDASNDPLPRIVPRNNSPKRSNSSSLLPKSVSDIIRRGGLNYGAPLGLRSHLHHVACRVQPQLQRYPVAAKRVELLGFYIRFGTQGRDSARCDSGLG